MKSALALLLVAPLGVALPAQAAGVPASPAATTAPALPGKAVRNDYANAAFASALGEALKAFYSRRFVDAQNRFEAALAIVPDNTLAISFLNASAAHTPGALDSLIGLEEDTIGKQPKSVLAHTRLGFSYMFSGLQGRDRSTDAREELNLASQLDPKAQAPHVGLGIMRYNDRSANRAKVEFLAAIENDANNVLAREYLGQLYQIDLRDPQRGLAYVIDVPNLVPGYADIYFHIASIMDDLKQYNEAVRYATLGLETDTGHVGEAGQHGLTLLAKIYLEQKKVADAKRVLNQAVAANTDTTYAKTLLDKIAKGDFDDKDAKLATPPPASKKR